MKKETIETMIKTGLQEQACQYKVTDKLDERLQAALDNIPARKMEEMKMKRFKMKKAVIAVAVAVMAIGTISIASGKGRSIISHSLNIPSYISYEDMEKAAAKAGVQINAPEQFSNDYCFNGIYMVDTSLENEDKQTTDSFTSMEILYKKGDDTVSLEVQPRPMSEELKAANHADVLSQDNITYYYSEMHNKWVPVDYVPTEEEQQAMEAGTLNIGVGASEISYSDSKTIWWEINGQQYTLFCMDNDISKEDFFAMALEVH